jgi:hypothetical protein
VTATELQSVAYTLPVSTAFLTQNLTVTTTEMIPASTAFLTSNLTVTSTLPGSHFTITTTLVPTTFFSASTCIATKTKLKIIETTRILTSLYCRFSTTKTVTEIAVEKIRKTVTVTETATVSSLNGIGAASNGGEVAGGVKGVKKGH